MPDWISHLLIGYIAINVLSIKNKKAVYIGTLLPDLFKIYIPLSKIFGFTSELPLNFFAPLHTVFGVILTGIFVSSFFTEWRRSFALIMLGASLHLTLDRLLYPWGGEILTFYPLWLGELNTGIFWPDSFLPLIILSSISSIFYLKNKLR